MMAETRIATRQGLIPNCTLIPNLLLDGVMSRVSGGEWKALCYLCRLAATGAEDADLDEIAFATGVEEEDLEADLEELQREGLVESRITLPGDREVYWLAVGEGD
jgi:hypothetical protein